MYIIRTFKLEVKENIFFKLITVGSIEQKLAELLLLFVDGSNYH